MTVSEIDRDRCSGCKMCGDVCPKNAVDFKNDENGFWYPVVDNKLCIKCGICSDKCPFNNDENYSTERSAYAAWSRDDDIRRESTSGGLYYEFARFIIAQHGYIVGSAYTDDYCGAYHTWSDSMEGLKKIMGSKYFQSDTVGIYKKTEELLKSGRLVLFTGAPCQVAALKIFLNHEYDNLIAIDFICRGVPSPMLQKKKIELYEKEAKSKVTSYRDKSKYVGWSNFGEFITFANGKKRFISRWKDEINNCFIEKNLNLRTSCYVCEFKDGNNASDITIGDFWGIDNVTEKDMEYGVSALIVNTDSGKKFIDSIKKYVYMEGHPVQEVGQGNPAYLFPAERPAEREKFYESVRKVGLKKTVRIYTRRGVKGNIKKKIHIMRRKMQPYKFLLKDCKKIKWINFVHYNFFCKAVHRKRHAFLVPYRGTVIRISDSADILLNANVLLNYYPCYKYGRQNTLFSIGNCSKLLVNNQLEIAYGNTFSISDNAEFESGYLFTGVGASIICRYRMKIGNHVMLGRDVCVFDSDYHDIYNGNWNKINPDKEVAIEDNVWIGARSMVLKGSYVREGAIVGANSMVFGEVESGRCFVNERKSKSVGERIYWKR